VLLDFISPSLGGAAAAPEIDEDMDAFIGYKQKEVLSLSDDRNALL
jgi:hypothetical protein